MVRIILLWIYCLAYMALADRSVTIAWDAQPDVEFIVRAGTAIVGKVATNQSTVTIPDAKTAITVTAKNIAGESEPSEPLVIPAAPANPKGVRVVEIRRTTISKP